MGRSLADHARTERVSRYEVMVRVAAPEQAAAPDGRNGAAIPAGVKGSSNGGQG